mgnify:FL=1
MGRLVSRLERGQQLESLLERERFDPLLKIALPARRSNDEQQNKTP